MSKRSRQHKQGHLGPAFHEWLEYLEYVECVTQTNKRPGKPKYMAMNDKLFHCETDADFQRMMQDSAPVDAWLARCVRSSVKYKTSASTLALMVHKYESELKHIRKTTPIHLPHEWVTLIVDDFGKETDSFLICLQETTSRTGKAYDDLGVEADEKWITANICFYRRTGVDLMKAEDRDTTLLHLEATDKPSKKSAVDPNCRLSYCPVEVHMTKGRVWDQTNVINAKAHGVQITEEGERAIQIAQGVILAFLESFNLSSVLRQKTAGIAPMPRSYRPAKRRKRHEFPQFEHTIIQMEIDAPEPSQAGRSVFQPHKRLHQVRGFWRHYKKTGKKVWVRPHWRGDEALGVVKRDVELITHPERVADEAQHAQ